MTTFLHWANILMQYTQPVQNKSPQLELTEQVGKSIPLDWRSSFSNVMCSKNKVSGLPEYTE